MMLRGCYLWCSVGCYNDVLWMLSNGALGMLSNGALWMLSMMFWGCYNDVLWMLSNGALRILSNGALRMLSSTQCLHDMCYGESMVHTVWWANSFVSFRFILVVVYENIIPNTY